MSVCLLARAVGSGAAIARGGARRGVPVARAGTASRPQARTVYTPFVTSKTPFKLSTLSYAYGDLAPVISAEIMEYHHGKHHKGACV